MGTHNSLFEALGIKNVSNGNVRNIAKQIGIPVSKLKYYNQTNTFPSGRDLDAICAFTQLTPYHLMLRMGKIDHTLLELIQKHAESIYTLLQSHIQKERIQTSPSHIFETQYGVLYHGDSIPLMRTMESESIDLIFADPPFNLNKRYPSKINDSLQDVEYLEWTEEWGRECVRLLKYGGSLFIWNIPKWNIPTAFFLKQFLTFRDWITVDSKYSFPIPNRLYPSHYSLLYFCKGEKPNTFHPDRLPMPVCPKCKHDLRDYGGHKRKMNPQGVNLTDVWTDIFPVRHSKYKTRRDANELPLKLVDRVLEIASNEGDSVFDPFGGAGTTYIAAEIKQRRWIGCEIGPVDGIITRFQHIEEEKQYLEKIRHDYNALFTKETLKVRQEKGLWTCESVRNNHGRGITTKRKLCEFAKQQELFVREA